MLETEVTTGATCEAQVKSSPPTNQRSAFYRFGCPSCHPTNSVRTSLMEKTPNQNFGIELCCTRSDHRKPWRSCGFWRGEKRPIYQSSQLRSVRTRSLGPGRPPTSLALVASCLSIDGVALQSRAAAWRGEQTRRAATSTADQYASPAAATAAAVAGPVVRRRPGLQHVVLMFLGVALALGHVRQQARRRLVQPLVVVKVGGRGEVEWRSDEWRGGGGFLRAAVIVRRHVMTSTMTYDDDDDG